DEEGELECSLPVTHSSTDGSTILLEVGEITDEHKDHLRQLYTHYLSTRSLRIKQNSFQTIRDYICEFSARDQKELVQYLRSLMSQGDISPEDPLEQFLYRIAGADGAGAGGMDEEDKSEEEDEDECEEEGEMASASGSSPSASVNTMLAGIEGRSTAREVPGIVNYVPTASFCYRHRLIRVGFNSEERKRMHALTQRIKRKHFAVVRDTANLAKALFSIVGVVNKEREEVEVTGHHFTPETFYSKAHHSESNFVSYFVSAWDTKDSSYEGRTYDFKEFVLMM
ncbi:MAG: hypothetical protein Q8Q56_01165, partial [Alphaproteobacteria bacterium]|nr:hypothetical protein [Alphaproteobacteria bacterium]